MFRGELVRKLGDLELAAFCVRHAAEREDGLGQSPTQKAIVQSFLKNYDKVSLTSTSGRCCIRSSACLVSVDQHSDERDSRQAGRPSLHVARSNADEGAALERRDRQLQGSPQHRRELLCGDCIESVFAVTVLNAKKHSFVSSGHVDACTHVFFPRFEFLLFFAGGRI